LGSSDTVYSLQQRGLIYEKYPESGNRESSLVDLYTGMIGAQTGARNQIRPPGGLFYGIEGSDGIGGLFCADL
jgi:hypothetical protein